MRKSEAIPALLRCHSYCDKFHLSTETKRGGFLQRASVPLPLEARTEKRTTRQEATIPALLDLDRHDGRVYLTKRLHLSISVFEDHVRVVASLAHDTRGLLIPTSRATVAPTAERGHAVCVSSHHARNRHLTHAADLYTRRRRTANNEYRKRDQDQA